MFTLVFWKAALERCLKTAAQAIVAVLTVGGATVGFADIDWVASGWLVLVAAAVSVLTSMVSAGATNGSPSLTTERLDGDQLGK